MMILKETFYSGLDITYLRNTTCEIFISIFCQNKNGEKKKERKDIKRVENRHQLANQFGDS